MDEAAVIEVSTECKTSSVRQDSRETEDPPSTYSASVDGSVVRYYLN
jgi:hypothetical protein